jgi:hypothetical protein
VLASPILNLAPMPIQRFWYVVRSLHPGILSRWFFIGICAQLWDAGQNTNIVRSITADQLGKQTPKSIALTNFWYF